MTNNVLYVSDGDYGKRVGYLSAVVQGQYGQVIPVEIRDLANNVVNLTGYSTITGTLNDQRGNVTNIAGTLALDATPSTAPNANWTIAAADFGTPGVFMVMLSFSNGSATLKTIPVALTVHADPAATAVAGTALVGVTTAQAALIAALAQLSGLANFNGTGGATGIKINLSATAAPGVGDDSGDGYAIGSIWLDTTNDNIYMATDVTVGAANWEQINGAGGGASDVTDLTTTTGLPAQRLRVAGAGGLEYRTTEQDLADLQDAGALATTDIGVSVQAYSAKTAAIAALTWAANSIILLTGTATASVQALAAHVVTFIQSASAADARTAIGAGTGNGTYTDNSTVKANDGTVSAPGLAFNGEASTGWYRSAAGVMRLALIGVNQWTFGGTNFSPASSTGPKMMNEAASSTNPVFVKSDDLTSGLGWGKTGVPVIVSSGQPTCGFAYLSGIVGSAQSVIANGAGDVTLVLSGMFTVSDGAGNVAGGVITATTPSGTFNLYDDGGTNTCQLQVAADGSVTVIRTAGSRTYAVNLNLNWQ